MDNLYPVSQITSAPKISLGHQFAGSMGLHLLFTFRAEVYVPPDFEWSELRKESASNTALLVIDFHKCEMFWVKHQWGCEEARSLNQWLANLLSQNKGEDFVKVRDKAVEKLISSGWLSLTPDTAEGALRISAANRTSIIVTDFDS